jgi:hypothetical protein
MEFMHPLQKRLLVFYPYHITLPLEEGEKDY